MALLQSLNRVSHRSDRERRRSRCRNSRPSFSCESLEARALLTVLNITCSANIVEVNIGTSGVGTSSPAEVVTLYNGINPVTTSYYQNSPSALTGINVVTTEDGFNDIGISGTLSSVPVNVNMTAGTGSVTTNSDAGNVTVIGNPNSDDSLEINQGIAEAETCTITSSTVSSAIGTVTEGIITYSAMPAVLVQGGLAPNDIYNVIGTQSGTSMNIYPAHVATATINVCPTKKNLSTIQGNLDVFGGGPGITVNIDDQNNSVSDTYTLASPSTVVSDVTRTGAAEILLTESDTGAGPFGAVNLYGGSGNDTYNIENEPSANAVSITGGSGNDTFNMYTYLTAAAINGGGGTNTLNYSNYAINSQVTVDLQNDTATGTSGFANIQKLVGAPSHPTVLIGANTTNTWSITANNGGTVNSFAFSGVGYLTGGTGMDAFDFSPAGSVTVINGGGGGDWLDYATFTTAVTVNLVLDEATDTLAIANIQNVRGGQGIDTLIGDAQGNILIGGAGTNTITGGSGPSILIGDKGKDTVTGNSDDDILIAGYTSYDPRSLANDMALESILTEWQSSDSYSTRISKIKSGVGTGSADKLVWGTTVFDNSVSEANTLTGAGAMNWFFANVSHTTTNKTSGEQLN